MFTIGITGNIGSGKSTVSKILKGLGAKVISADELAHNELKKGAISYKKVISIFGEDILRKGVIDRKKLGQIVFRDAKKLKVLNKIIHPQVIKIIKSEIKRFYKQNNERILVIEVPLLFEVGLDRLVDFTVVVNTKKSIRIKRVQEKLKISKSEILAREAFQLPVQEKIRYADIIIDNSSSNENLRKRVKEIWQRLYQRAKN